MFTLVHLPAPIFSPAYLERHAAAKPLDVTLSYPHTFNYRTFISSPSMMHPPQR